MDLKTKSIINDSHFIIKRGLICQKVYHSKPLCSLKEQTYLKFCFKNIEKFREVLTATIIRYTLILCRYICVCIYTHIYTHIYN